MNPSIITTVRPIKRFASVTSCCKSGKRLIEKLGGPDQKYSLEHIRRRVLAFIE